MNWSWWAWLVAGLGWAGWAHWTVNAYQHWKGIQIGVLRHWRVTGCPGGEGHDPHVTVRLRGILPVDVALDGEGASMLAEHLRLAAVASAADDGARRWEGGLE